MLDEELNAKDAWLKQVKHHRKRLKGLPRVGFNPNAGNVEHNINMMNKMLGSSNAPIMNPINGQISADSASISIGESLNESAYLMHPSIEKLIQENIDLIDTGNFELIYSKISGPDVAELTKVLLAAGINPIDYLIDIPADYACMLDIKELFIPRTIKTINECAFYSCHDLEIVEIEEGCQYIGDNAFTDCPKLTEVYLPSSLEELGDQVFKDCTHLVEIIYAGTISDWLATAEGWHCFSNCLCNAIKCSDGIYEIIKG